MAPSLGKRKRITREELEQPSRSPSPSSSASSSSDGKDLQAIFQRAFEARFAPLQVSPKKPKISHVEPSHDEDSEPDSDWPGISSDNDDEEQEQEQEDTVEVISYANTPNTTNDRTSKAELRAFMSSKPPSSSSTPLSTQPPLSTSKANAKSDTADLTETSHLKNDLALQRLLRDSHLLSTASTSTSGSGTSTPTTLAATGALRHKSTDLALLSLGAKKSIHVQKNMPMALRKGLAAKAKQREEKRRADAKEAGIVLEREVRVQKRGSGDGNSRGSARGRDRGVGGPSVGRFKGGMLKLSRRDVADINGGGGGGGRGRGKGRRGR
jgi:hypothetical protein